MTKQELEMYLIKQFILNYRISLKTASEIFKREQNDIYCELMDIKNPFEKKAIMYVLDYETKETELIDQKVAKRKAMIFLTKFYGVKTKDEKNKLIRDLNENTNIEHLKNKRREDLTEEDISKIINFRYKYAVPAIVMYEVFDVTRHWLEYHESKLDENFQKRLKFLNEYNCKFNETLSKRSH